MGSTGPARGTPEGYSASVGIASATFLQHAPPTA
jgi:hypothetical protein